MFESLYRKRYHPIYYSFETSYTTGSYIDVIVTKNTDRILNERQEVSKGFRCANRLVPKVSPIIVFASVSWEVMDFFRNRYHRINRTLLTLIGQWPYQSPKWRRCQQTIFHFNIISVMLVQGIKMFETRGDVDVMIECCTPMGVQVVACAKSINCMINHRKMKDLLECMKKDWSSLTNEDEIKILEKYAEDGKKLSLAYAIFIFYTMAMYLLIPLAPQVLDYVLPLNESRQRVFLYHTEYYVEAESYYYPIMLHSYSATLMQVSIIVATDAMFAVYIQHTCGKFAIVGYRMERIAEDVSLKFEVKPAIEDDFKYRELIECIKAHQDAIKFAVLVESSYSKLFIFQLGMNMLLISISLLQLLTKFGQYEEMYRHIQFISGQMFHLFFNSWPGQKLINQNNFDSYAAGWYTSSLRSRRLLKIVMLSGTSPPKITASRLYDVSMENFAQVVQTSISYFTVLASLR